MRGLQVKPFAIALLVMSMGLSGCASSRGAYDWGEYDELLYQSYKDPSKIEALRIGLEEHLVALESSNGLVAPGLYADLGTLYLEAGDTEGAILFYEKERAAWPESKYLMDALITNLERRRPNQQEAP